MVAGQLETDQSLSLLETESGLEVVRSSRQLTGVHDHTHINKIDVKCNSGGMAVTIDFEAPFNGVIYSKGNFNDPKCR